MEDEVWNRLREEIDEDYTEEEWADHRARLELSDEILALVRSRGFRFTHWRWTLERIPGTVVQEGVMGEWRPVRED